MVENRAFTLDNLELVNRVEWDPTDGTVALLSSGPEPLDEARVIWPDNRESQPSSLGDAILAVTFLEAITGLRFTKQGVAIGCIVWVQDDS